jgi:peptidyl-prolyl cis-trans isomerase SurA
MLLNAQEVLTISNKQVSLSEFKSIFFKNSHNQDLTKEYLDEYMELFVNFKLKVLEAEELGMDTNIAFINELEGYRKQLAKPYLRNNDFDSLMLSESYSRIQKDVNVSHILISIDPIKGDDYAYEKALKIRNSIINDGVPFSQAASNHSDDPSANSNSGDLGYFTAFMMVYNFETASYETPVGEISLPIKTKFGYHLIKVNDKRKSIGQVEVAHIMFKTGVGANEDKIKEANKKIIEVTELLNNGEDFSDLAERLSEDRSSAVKGGVLPIFGVGKMVAEFENVAFSLTNSGDISKPFLTDYGWHIVKLIKKNMTPKFDDIKDDLKKMIDKDTRSELSQKALYEKLRKTYKVINKPSVYSSFRKSYAKLISKGKFNKNSIDKTIILSIDGFGLTVDSFSEYILDNQSVGSDIDQIYFDFVNLNLLKYEDSRLEEKYPKYKSILNEYREGILLFNLTNEKVWEKAVKDTSGLISFFSSNQSSYRFPKRVDATIYKCNNLSIAKKVKKRIYQKKRGVKTNSQILDEVNQINPFSLQITEDKFARGDNNYVDSIDWKLGISKDIILKDGSYVLIDIKKLLADRFKDLDETRGKVISDYQSQLELDWIIKLRKKYTVKINNEVLYSIIK